MTARALTALALLASATASRAAEFSHRDWTEILREFVDEQGFVDYRGLARDRPRFDRYVESLEATSPDSAPARFPTRDDALAYWINAYNAMVVRGVLERGVEIESVWGEGWFGLGFFTRRDVVLGGRTTSLKELEDDVVRARFRDPRVHAALNCASRSCPRLPREAFEGGTLDESLDRAMREFVAEPRNCAIDFERRTVSLSKIFDWFEDDFLSDERSRGNRDPSILDWINRYRPLNGKIPSTLRVRYFDYDKRLNRQEAIE